MRKSLPVFLPLAFLLAACLPGASTATPPTSAPTLTASATITPTRTVTPIITPSPTIIKIPTVDYNLTPTPPGYAYASPTPFPWIPTSTRVPTETPSSVGEGFEWVRLSDYRVYWGDCRSNSVKISAAVSYPDEVYSVTLFMRLRRTTAEIFAPWSRGLGMEPTSAVGVWAQDIYGASVDNHALWRRGWIWFQIVAVGANNLEVGRTRIFMDMIRLEPCMCMTPPCDPGD